MALTVCTFTAAPGPFVAASLGRVRDVADEILVVADAAVGDRDLQEYARVADRLFRAEFEFLEFHLPWLHRQCRGDWVLRLDGDECVSDALVRQLPDLIASREALQYWIPRRWAYPDAGHWIAELPWWPDPQLRLVRNDGTLSFDGALHSSARPASPHGYVEAPIYHLAALVDPLAARWRRTQRYEALRPELQAPGGGPMAAYYLPERFASRPPRPVPPADAAHLREALAAGRSAPSEQATAAAAAARWVERREFERCWPVRSVGAAARRARLEVVDPEVQLERMSAGENRLVLVRATNEGDEEWPGGADGSPPVRIGIRWRSADGALLSDDQRGVLSQAIAAGATRLVGILVQAPAEPGSYQLGLDVVIEGGGWFGCEVRHPVRVASAHERVILTANAAVPPRRRRFRRRRIAIPRIVHSVWLGPAELPDEYLAFRESWASHNPGWELRLWTDESVARELPHLQLERGRNWAERSDVARYEILCRLEGYTRTAISNADARSTSCCPVSRASLGWRFRGGCATPSSAPCPDILRSRWRRRGRWNLLAWGCTPTARARSS